MIANAVVALPLMAGPLTLQASPMVLDLTADLAPVALGSLLVPLVLSGLAILACRDRRTHQKSATTRQGRGSERAHVQRGRILDTLSSVGVCQEVHHVMTNGRAAHRTWSAHLRLMEAKRFLASARRLAREGDFVAAENALSAATQDVTDARSLLPAGDAGVAELTRAIEQAVAEFRTNAQAAVANIEDAVKSSSRLLAEFDQAA
ncbi:MAG: hypothetical protein ACE5I7_15445 [Candidatus Binatia bacterium]